MLFYPTMGRLSIRFSETENTLKFLALRLRTDQYNQPHKGYDEYSRGREPRHYHEACAYFAERIHSAIIHG